MSKQLIRPLVTCFAAIVFITTAWIVLSGFEWKEIFLLLEQVAILKYVVSIVLLHLSYLLLRNLRWTLLIRSQNLNARFWNLYWANATLISISIYTPAQFGEALKIEVLRRNGLLNAWAGTGSFMAERLMDLSAVLLMGVVGVIIYGGQIEIGGGGFGITLLIAICFVVALIAVLWYLRTRDIKNDWLAQIAKGARASINWPASILLTALSWGTVVISWQISLEAVGLTVSVIETMLLLSFTTLGVIASFIPGGLGISELLASELLIRLGNNDLLAQAGAVMLRIYGLITVTVGLTHLIIWRLRPTTTQPQQTQVDS